MERAKAVPPAEWRVCPPITQAIQEREYVTLNPPLQAPSEEMYETGLGILTFAQLHERTRKYAAFILHHTHQVQPADIDDGLQVGFTQLWERLNQEPTSLQDKSLAWIGKGIVYQALHAIRQDWGYQKHTQAEQGRSSTDRRGTHSLESRQIDQRTDLHLAITNVANDIVSNGKGKQADYDLWALYGLTMLHTSSSEISRLFRVREQSMHAAYSRVRERLNQTMPPLATRNELGSMAQRHCQCRI
jgi:DNA-directed RNA polymerase specialized sigma24 family protein